MRYFATSTPACALDVVVKGWAKDYMVHGFHGVSSKNLTEKLVLELVKSTRRLFGLSCSLK